MDAIHDPLLGFDPMAQDPSRNSGGYKSLPVSDAKGHLVVFTSHEMKPLSTKEDGSRMEFAVLIVEEGPNKGKTGTHSENMGHVNDEYREMAEARVTAICRCVGLRTAIRNPQTELYNKPFRMVVDYQDGHGPGPKVKDGNQGFTRVTKFFDANGLEPDDPNCGLGGAGVATGAAVPGGIPQTQLNPAQLAAMQAGMATAPNVGGGLPQAGAMAASGQVQADPAGVNLAAQQQALAAQQAQQQAALQQQANQQALANQQAQAAAAGAGAVVTDPALLALQAQMGQQAAAGGQPDPANAQLPPFMN